MRMLARRAGALLAAAAAAGLFVAV